MFHLQKTSQLVTVTPDILLSDYEKQLNAEGFTGGYRPSTGFHIPLKECLENRTPNFYFMKYGGIDDLCVGGLFEMAGGRVFPIKVAPRSATGPDLRKVLVGSRQLLGRFQEVTLRVFQFPEAEIWGLALVESGQEAVSVLRTMRGVMIQPLFARILDSDEGGGLLRSLNLDSRDHMVFAVKLSGMKQMVDAEREAITRMHEGKSIVFYWPLRSAEIDLLDNTIISIESYHDLLERCTPLVGRPPRIAATPAEVALEKFLLCSNNSKN